MKKSYSIGVEFSRYPGPRYKKQGDNSGEEFREEILLPIIKENGVILSLTFDDALSYGSSFLEEAFGGLVRNHGYSEQDIYSKIKFVTESDSLKKEIKLYVHDAAKHAKKVVQSHAE